MVRCADNSLYTGYTTNLDKRIHAHNHLKSGAKYTRSRRPVKLVFSQEFETQHQARTKESAIKQLRKNQKEALQLNFLKQKATNAQEKNCKQCYDPQIY